MNYKITNGEINVKRFQSINEMVCRKIKLISKAYNKIPNLHGYLDNVVISHINGLRDISFDVVNKSDLLVIFRYNKPRFARLFFVELNDTPTYHDILVEKAKNELK